MTTTSPAPISTFHFWLLTVGLLLVWTIVIASAAPADSSVAPTAQHSIYAAAGGNQELMNTRNCKALCEHCGCLGFYCGEECICECNNENSDTECIATMQSNARKLSIPFEILIQGPSANRFVRNALQFEQNADRKNVGTTSVGSKNSATSRNKRSTVVIYKPALENALDGHGQTDKIAAKKSTNASASGRHKRSVPQLDWFTDLANTLVRPAPLRGAKNEASKVQVESSATAQQKRSAIDLDRSWFTDNTSKLLRPAPIFKRQRSAEESYDDSPVMSAIEQIPQAVKETIRRMKDAAISDDFTDAVKMKFRDGTDVLQNKMQQDFDFMPRIHNDIADVYSKLKMATKDVGLPPMEMPTVAPAQAPKYIIPWFRPVRFLQRVQQAIN